MMESINSSENEKIKLVRRLLSDANYRRKSDLFVLEHPKSILEMCEKRPERIDYVLVDEDSESVSFGDVSVITVASVLFKSLSEVKTNQGLMAVLRKQIGQWSDVDDVNTIMVLDGVQDPANVGAIVRNCVAFGVEVVVMGSGCADPYHPKSVRAMAGLVDRVTFVDDEDLAQIVADGLVFVACDGSGDEDLNDLEWPQKVGIIVGAEGQGVSQGVVDVTKAKLIRIPMAEGAESLNVAVASGIVMQSRYAKKFS